MTRRERSALRVASAPRQLVTAPATNPGLRTLALVSTGYGHPTDEELRSLEDADLYPRVSLFKEQLGADLVDERFLERVALPRRLLYRGLPDIAAQIAEAFIAGSRYDAVISWAERLALPFAGLMKTTGMRVPHVAIVSWISNPKKAWILKRVHSHIDRVVTGSSRQRDFAIEQLGLPPHKVKLLKLFVDQRFFRPLDRETDMICAVGREMRDYPTLVEALRPLNIRCHIAAGAHRGKLERWVKAVDHDALPAHVTLGKLGYRALRDLYARSRFVVIPLLPSDTDNGVTAILEAMAMGKAVICTRTDGQIDVVEDGVTGVLVPPGDVVALRRAIVDLSSRPQLAAQMGSAGRRRVEEAHTIDRYMAELRVIVEGAIADHGLGRRTARLRRLQ